MKGYQGLFAFFCKDEEDRNRWFKFLKRIAISKDAFKHYSFESILGSGSFGKVYLSKKKNGEKYAIKTIDKSLICDNLRSMRLIIREIEILRKIDHPSIIKLYEVYESREFIHLVMEYLEGGDLLAYFNKKGNYSEKDASMVILKILEGINYCHSINVIHRDLKLDNIMLVYIHIIIVVKQEAIAN